MDPIEKLGNEQLRERAIDLMVQLEKGTEMRPVLWLLTQARERAAKAMVLFIDAKADDVSAIRTLQAEIRVYDDMVKSARDLIAAGRAAEHAISEHDRAAMQEVVLDMTEEDRQLYGLQQQGID